MSNRKRTLFARLKASQQRVREMEAVIGQLKERLQAERSHFSKSLNLLQMFAEQNATLKRKVGAFQTLANEMEA